MKKRLIGTTGSSAARAGRDTTVIAHIPATKAVATTSPFPIIARIFVAPRRCRPVRLSASRPRATNLRTAPGGVMGKLGENSGCSLGIFAFDGFCLDTRTGELRRGDREIRLTPRAAAVL